MPTHPEVGSLAPDFELMGSHGKTVSLKHFKGQPVVLYFYPKDDTPGCTVEACEFGKEHPKFGKLDAVVLGVSPDSLESHAKFIKKFDLPFQLLVDQDHKLASRYGLWVEKQMFGKTFMGVQRATFLIDREGRIAAAWPKVKAEGHAGEVLKALRAVG
jgi:thioredoxin-dependent peroxiredoxin